MKYVFHDSILPLKIDSCSWFRILLLKSSLKPIFLFASAFYEIIFEAFTAMKMLVFCFICLILFYLILFLILLYYLIFILHFVLMHFMFYVKLFELPSCWNVPKKRRRFALLPIKKLQWNKRIRMSKMKERDFWFV